MGDEYERHAARLFARYGPQARGECGRRPPANTAMNLFDLLACPRCRDDVGLDADGSHVVCVGCGQTYPVRDGIPIMLTEPERAMVAHEGELPARPGYSRW